MNIAIRVDLYDSIGWGHFKRSLILEKELVKKGYNVEFIFGELQSSSIVYKLMQGINYIIIGRDAEKNFWQDNSYKYKVVIYDVAHHDNRIDFTHTMNMLKILATNKVKTLFFDGAGKEMISSLYEMPVSLIVIPYACNHSICLNSVAIIGPEFFILDDKIKEYKKKFIIRI